MNLLDALLFLSAAQGIMLGSVLMIGGLIQRSRKAFLGLFLLSFSVIILGWVGFWTSFYRTHVWAMGWTIPFIWLLGPALWGFYRSKKLEYRKRDLLHLLPFFVQQLIISQLVAAQTSRPALFSLSGVFGQFLEALPPWLGLLRVGGMLIYLIVIYRHLRKHAIPVNWRRTPALIAFGVFIAGSAAYYLIQYSLGYYLWFDYALSLVMVILVYYFAYRSQLAFMRPVKTAPSYAGSSLTEQDARRLVDKIRRHLKTRKPYLNPTYSLDQLAEELHTPKYRISQTLNTYGGSSFNELINTLRAQEAEGMLRDVDYEHYKIEAIGEAAGFNNRVTFNTYFKQIFGNSPGKYRRQLQQQSEVK